MRTPSTKRAIFSIQKMTKESFSNNTLLKPFLSPSTPEINLEGIIDLYCKTVQNNSISSFHSNFSKFKKILYFKRIQRKTKIDSILKKCKAKFIRLIEDATYELLEDNFSLPRFPSVFIVNINIRDNKQILNMKLKQIYQKFNRDFNYNQILKHIDLNKKDLFIKLMNYTYQELFEQFIESNRFIEDCELISKREGEKFSLLYQYVAKIYINYYSMSKGNATKDSKSDSVRILRSNSKKLLCKKRNK